MKPCIIKAKEYFCKITKVPFSTKKFLKKLGDKKKDKMFDL